jgi:hydroxycarboxylate dehydrogenase B
LSAAAETTSMRSIPASKLVALVTAIMRRAGCNPEEAATIARRLVDSNLVGHDSHGVLRVSKYLEWMRAGWLHANQKPTVVFENDSLAIVDGNRGFGQVVGEFAGALGTGKAVQTGIALIGLRNCGHLGRVGDWAELAAEAGQVSIHFLNTSAAQRVAPFGGSDRRLSTNPITIGIPVAGGEPIVMDVTTSMVAEGKLMVAVNRGERVPEGWIIDKHGRSTTEPKDFYDGGALLTVGGHKGSGLSIVTDLLAGAIATGKSSDPADTVLCNNMLSIYIAPDVYDAGHSVQAEVARFLAWVKDSPPARADAPVLLPGEVERKTRAERSARGVPIDDTTHADLLAAAESTGIAKSDAAAMIT